MPTDGGFASSRFRSGSRSLKAASWPAGRTRRRRSRPLTHQPTMPGRFRKRDVLEHEARRSRTFSSSSAFS